MSKGKHAASWWRRATPAQRLLVALPLPALLAAVVVGFHARDAMNKGESLWPVAIALLLWVVTVVASVLFVRRPIPGIASAEAWRVRSRQLLKISAPIAIGIAILVAVTRPSSESADAETLAAGMKAKVKLPLQVDDDTRLDDIRALSKHELGYFLTLTKSTKGALDASSFTKRMEGQLRGDACQNPNKVELLKAGFSLSMVYRTSDGTEVARVGIAPKDCGF